VLERGKKSRWLAASLAAPMRREMRDEMEMAWRWRHTYIICTSYSLVIVMNYLLISNKTKYFYGVILTIHLNHLRRRRYKRLKIVCSYYYYDKLYAIKLNSSLCDRIQKKNKKLIWYKNIRQKCLISPMFIKKKILIG
jgi:hypothetical protein